MRKLLIGCLIVAVCASVPSAAVALSLGTCTNTGYTFMGGWMVYQTPPSTKDYFMTSNSPVAGTYWGFGWLKFGDLPTSVVDKAWLSLDYYRDMTAPPTPGDPVDVAIYAVDADVAGITAANVADFKDHHIVGSAVATYTFTELGIGCWEITDIVNDWITGDNYGLAVIGWDDVPQPPVQTHNLYFAGLPGGGGGAFAPTLATDCVPEPGTIALLCSGGLVLLWLAFQRRKRLKEA